VISRTIRMVFINFVLCVAIFVLYYNSADIKYYFSSEYQIDHDSPIQQIDWLPQGSVLAYVSGDPKVYVLDTVPYSQIASLEPSPSVYSIAWRPIQNELAIQANTLFFWDLDQQNYFEIEGLSIDSSTTLASGPVDWNAEGNLFSFKVSVFSEMEEGFYFRIFDTHEQVISVNIPAVGTSAWPTWRDNQILFNTGNTIRIFQTDNEDFHDLDAYSDLFIDTAIWGDTKSNSIYTAGATFEDIFISIWSLDSNQELFRKTSLESRVTQMAWNDANQLLATGHQDGTISVWNISVSLRTIVLLTVLEVDDTGRAISSLAWNTEGTKLAAGNLDGQFVVWQLSDY